MRIGKVHLRLPYWFAIHKSFKIRPWGVWMRRSIGTGVATLLVTLLSVAATGTARASEGEAGGIAGITVKGEQFRLKLHHLHTGESIDVVYRVGNTYLPEAMAKLNYFLRDHRTNDEGSYDPKEFDLLHSLLAKLGRSGSEIDIVCGYRTPQSNNYLRTRGANTGVAQNSQHVQSKAIDIRIPGVSTTRLRDTALSLGLGGVGYYPISQFVHVDVGPVRRWSYFGSGD
jgi:uncharacterized protein YcbK (DUF882 family)